MKIVEQADQLMQEAQVLYVQYKDIMTPLDRTSAEDKMTLWVPLCLPILLYV